ncbi:CAB/ELIP/HLIP-related protein [Halothece sp. PCC 7418]|uniref:chlorophyll a/b-binding protein n=1 Tax=Halothece sp. (strain PCC 7418) TaxID=65093 RepID=UPI0002A067C1|nr:chlorophyll a/b-binding protein [Halothece sp. PCC 7418]AFZ44994.1 CAB/ELIP/HLIP-related protein [Halothece sp. PCC 7418]
MNEKTSNTEATATDESLIPELEEPSFGWTPYAERMNGRFAMIGLIALLLIEVITNQGFLAWLGLR